MNSTIYAVNNPGIYTNWQTAHIKGFPKQAEHNSSLDSLTNEQLSVFDHLLKEENIFLTGGGGVGKSHLISALYTHYPGLKKALLLYKNPSTNVKLPRIQLCALTGCAAILLGHKAKTLHSWAGIGLGKGTVSELYIKIRRNTKAMRNWLCTDLLVIDEISMMTADLLDKLNELAKKIRSNRQPFGGIQLLLVGDFYQLPPVNKSDEQTVFAFESATWKEIINTAIGLTKIMRQKDKVFQKILCEARTGSLTKESCTILNERQGLDWKTNKIRPTLLFPRRAEVDMINETNLRALQGRCYTYKARLVYDGKMPDGFTESDDNFQKALKMFDSNAAYINELELMLDAQVMLIANTDPDSGLVNGSRGIIVGFCPATELPIVEFINGIKKPVGHHAWPIEDYEFISRSQIPLCLAYAITQHKCQGSTLESALVDIGSGIFEYGQAYVALSRVRSLEALYVYDFVPLAFKAHPKVKAFYDTLVVATIIDANDVTDAVIKDTITNISDLQLAINALITTNSNATKSIMAESSKPIKAINVVKHDTIISETNVISITPNNWLYESIPANWKDSLSFCQNKLLELSTFLTDKEFLPSKENVWRTLELTPLDSIKIVILGQDPYPTIGNAHGLAFSVLPDVQPIPASLKNIYKELESDINGFISPIHGNLEAWAKQGIFLLNTVLTVAPGESQSHSKIGWEEVTDQIIRTIAATRKNIIFVLWGKSAQTKKKLLGLYLDKNKHRIFESAHPSPLSASKGFFGSKPFSTINGWLQEMGKEPINW